MFKDYIRFYSNKIFSDSKLQIKCNSQKHDREEISLVVTLLDSDAEIPGSIPAAGLRYYVTAHFSTKAQRSEVKWLFRWTIDERKATKAILLLQLVRKCKYFQIRKKSKNQFSKIDRKKRLVAQLFQQLLPLELRRSDLI